jgi:hypothetical protein
MMNEEDEDQNERLINEGENLANVRWLKEQNY